MRALVRKWKPKSRDRSRAGKRLALIPRYSSKKTTGRRTRRRGYCMLPTPRDKAIVLTVYTHGRLSREQVRRLFFRKAANRGSRALASIQAAGARLRKL